MLKKSDVRTKQSIRKGMLKRAFAKGHDEGVKMDLLIDWRMAVVNHEAKNGIAEMERRLEVTRFESENVDTGSRGLNAFNFIAHIEGRDDRISDGARREGWKNLESYKAIMKDGFRVDIDAIKRARAEKFFNVVHNTDSSEFLLDAEAEDLVKEGDLITQDDIRGDVGRVQAYLKFNDLVMVKHDLPNGSHCYTSKKSHVKPVFH